MFRQIISRFRRKYKKEFYSKMVKCASSTRIFHTSNLRLGRFIYIGPNCNINAQGGVSIGDGTILAPEVVILSSSHDYKRGSMLPYDVFDDNRAVEIGKGVWIGYGAMICPGVRIGDGAVVAMGAVVTRDVLLGQVVGGNPAKPISQRDSAKVAQMVMAEDYFHKKNWFGPRPRTMQKVK